MEDEGELRRKKAAFPGIAYFSLCPATADLAGVRVEESRCCRTE